MSDLVQTTSDSLCKLVRWAHSHGTICNLIPSLQHVARGSYGNVLTPEPTPNGSSVPVAVWGCSAGHAYHWPLSDHSNSCTASVNTIQGQERFVGGRPSKKVKLRFNAKRIEYFRFSFTSSQTLSQVLVTHSANEYSVCSSASYFPGGSEGIM